MLLSDLAVSARSSLGGGEVDVRVLSAALLPMPPSKCASRALCGCSTWNTSMPNSGSITARAAPSAGRLYSSPDGCLADAAPREAFSLFLGGFEEPRSKGRPSHVPRGTVRWGRCVRVTRPRSLNADAEIEEGASCSTWNMIESQRSPGARCSTWNAW